MHISCFPFNTKTTTLISIVFSSSLQPLHHAFPPPPPLSSQHYYHHHHIITSVFFTTFLLLSSSSSFSFSNRTWLWQTEHNLKELRKTIISRCFIVYLYLVSFSCMIPVLRCLRRRRSKPSVYSVCELVHNIVFESRRVARTYVDVFDWLISYTVCD